MTNSDDEKAPERRVRTGEKRIEAEGNRAPSPHPHAPAAGAHAAEHLINEDATPGSGALPSSAHRSGEEVDGGAG